MGFRVFWVVYRVCRVHGVCGVYGVCRVCVGFMGKSRGTPGRGGSLWGLDGWFGILNPKL